MKGIEDAFQVLAARIMQGDVATIDASQKPVAAYFSALWKIRAMYKTVQDDSQITFNKVTGFDWGRPNGVLPARMLNGLVISAQVDGSAAEYAKAEWAIYTAPAEGRFVVPDRPIRNVIPLAPTLCLGIGDQSRSLTMEELKTVNRDFRQQSNEYYLAQDLDDCP